MRRGLSVLSRTNVSNPGMVNRRCPCSGGFDEAFVDELLPCRAEGFGGSTGDQRNVGGPCDPVVVDDLRHGGYELFLDPGGFVEASGEHARIEAFGDVFEAVSGLAGCDGVSRAGLGDLPDFVAHALQEVGRPGGGIEHRGEPFFGPSDLVGLGGLDERDGGFVTAEWSKGAVVEPFGERRRVHDFAWGVRQAGREDCERGVWSAQGVLECVGEDAELFFGAVLEFVNVEGEPGVSVFGCEACGVGEDFGQEFALVGRYRLAGVLEPVGDLDDTGVDFDREASEAVSELIPESLTFVHRGNALRDPNREALHVVGLRLEGDPGGDEALGSGTLFDQFEGDSFPEALSPCHHHRRGVLPLG